MSAADYLAGAALLMVVVASAWFAGRAIAGALAPQLTGPSRTVGQAIGGLSVLIVVVEIAGTVGEFRVAPVVAGMAGVALIARVARGRPAEPDDRPDRRVGPGAAAVIGAVGALVVAEWVPAVLATFDHGFLDNDSLDYHLPFAARWVQTASLTHLQFASPDTPVAFHPANGELLHAIGMLLFRHDIVSPVLNLGWLALALLAAWCVGRPRGLGLVTLTATAAWLAVPIMANTQAGTAATDLVALACLLCSVALLMAVPFDDWTPGLVALAGLAGGLALGSKLTVIAPLGVLTIAVFAVSRRRPAVAAAWAGPFVLTGSFWYLRNLARVGSPIPTLHLPLLPAPRIALDDRYGFSVARYATDATVWRHALLPGLRQALSPGWPLLVAVAAAAGAAGLLRRSKGPEPRLLGAIGALSLAAYLVTPTTAFGPPGHPVLFVANLRYAVPGALCVTIAGLLTLGREARTLRIASTAAMVALVGLVGWYVGADPNRPTAHRVASIGGAIVLLGGAAVLGSVPRRWPRRGVLGAAVALGTLAVVAVGYREQHHYLRLRYLGGTHGADAAYSWARDVRDQRIATVGIFQKYPLTGLDLSNYVQYLGETGPHGSFTDFSTCPPWRDAVNRGHYQYLVVGPPFPDSPLPPAAPWVAADPAARRVLVSETTTVYRLAGPLTVCP